MQVAKYRVDERPQQCGGRSGRPVTPITAGVAGSVLYDLHNQVAEPDQRKRHERLLPSGKYAKPQMQPRCKKCEHGIRERLFP